MLFPTEERISAVAAEDLRYYQATYFFEKFKESCGSPDKPKDSSFHWIAYSDAFLMTLVSLQDFVSERKKRLLLRGAYLTYQKHKVKVPKGYDPNVLLVLKLMRNQTIHRYVFASPRQKGKARPPVTRVINVSVGGHNPGAWVQPRIHPKDMQRILKRAMNRFRKQKKNDPRPDVAETRLYLKQLKKKGSDYILLLELFAEGLKHVETVCGFKPLDPSPPVP